MDGRQMPPARIGRRPGPGPGAAPATPRAQADSAPRPGPASTARRPSPRRCSTPAIRRYPRHCPSADPPDRCRCQRGEREQPGRSASQAAGPLAERPRPCRGRPLAAAARQQRQHRRCPRPRPAQRTAAASVRRSWHPHHCFGAHDQSRPPAAAIRPTSNGKRAFLLPGVAHRVDRRARELVHLLEDVRRAPASPCARKYCAAGALRDVLQQRFVDLDRHVLVMVSAGRIAPRRDPRLALATRRRRCTP